MRPRFSIITAAYNAAKYIEVTIESVINQSYKNWELIIVDDESTDNTVSIVEKYCKLDKRIKLFNQRNKKQAAARNKGVKEAKGEWLCFLDSDDYWLSPMLETHERHINSIKADIFYTGGQKFNDLDGLKQEYRILYGKYESTAMYKELYKANPIPIQSIAVRSTLIEGTGFQDESADIVGCEDLDYWIRLAKNGAVFYGIEGDLFRYRMHTQNISKNIFQMRLALITALFKNFDKKHFNGQEIISIFYKRFDPLLIDLIKLGRIKQAVSLLESFKRIHSGFYIKINFLLLKWLKKYSYYFIKLVNKLNRLSETRIAKRTRFR